MITIGTTHGAPRFITGTTTIEAETRAAKLTATAARTVPAATERVSHAATTPASEAANPTVPAQRPALLKETTKQVEDTLNLAVKAVSTRAPSATTTMAGRKGVFRHAEVPASEEEEECVAALAGIDNRSFVRFLVLREI
jgi:hypothetical protein